MRPIRQHVPVDRRVVGGRVRGQVAVDGVCKLKKKFILVYHDVNDTRINDSLSRLFQLLIRILPIPRDYTFNQG